MERGDFIDSILVILQLWFYGGFYWH